MVEYGQLPISETAFLSFPMKKTVPKRGTDNRPITGVISPMLAKGDKIKGNTYPPFDNYTYMKANLTTEDKKENLTKESLSSTV